MTFDEFRNRYNGKYLEVAGSPNAKNQCVDLANGYIRDVLGHAIIEWTNAEDFPAKCMDFCDWIPNTPKGVPEKGDIVIWDFSTDEYGHIAVFISGNTRSFVSFDQNWPVGSPCHEQTHNYNNVIGWLHPREVIEMIPEGKLRGQMFVDPATGRVFWHIPDADTLNKYLGANAWNFVTTLDLSTEITNLKESNSILNGEVTKANGRIVELEGSVGDISAKLDTLEKAYGELEKINESYLTEIKRRKGVSELLYQLWLALKSINWKSIIKNLGRKQ